MLTSSLKSALQAFDPTAGYETRFGGRSMDPEAIGDYRFYLFGRVHYDRWPEAVAAQCAQSLQAYKGRFKALTSTRRLTMNELRLLLQYTILSGMAWQVAQRFSLLTVNAEAAAVINKVDTETIQMTETLFSIFTLRTPLRLERCDWIEFEIFCLRSVAMIIVDPSDQTLRYLCWMDILQELSARSSDYKELFEPFHRHFRLSLCRDLFFKAVTLPSLGPPHAAAAAAAASPPQVLAESLKEFMIDTTLKELPSFLLHFPSSHLERLRPLLLTSPSDKNRLCLLYFFSRMEKNLKEISDLSTCWQSSRALLRALFPDERDRPLFQLLDSALFFTLTLPKGSPAAPSGNEAMVVALCKLALSNFRFQGILEVNTTTRHFTLSFTNPEDPIWKDQRQELHTVCSGYIKSGMTFSVNRSTEFDAKCKSDLDTFLASLQQPSDPSAKARHREESWHTDYFELLSATSPNNREAIFAVLLQLNPTLNLAQEAYAKLKGLERLA